jgi:tRNA modification GTPase
MIAAIATGNAASAIGVIRLSGDGVHEAVSKIFRPFSGEDFAASPDGQLVYGALFGRDGALIDRCLATLRRAPRGYTGEDSAELQCHGSPMLLSLALDSLFAQGVRQALPGEFTKRAFLNGKLALAQAEAVMDLIEAETAQAAKDAAAALGGATARKLAAIYDELVDIISHYYAFLDEPGEETDEPSCERYGEVFTHAAGELSKLLAAFERNRLLKSGVPTVILGKPNTGKSTLLNALLGFDRAIVTSAPGTTRDTIEEGAVIAGVRLRLTDTAGLRDARDEAERIGVERSRQAARAAELALVVLDGSSELDAGDLDALQAAQAARFAVVVFNKMDLPSFNADIFDSFYGDFSEPDALVALSAATGEGIAALEAVISRLFPRPETPMGELLTNTRQFDAVARAKVSLLAALEALRVGSAPDIVLTEAEGALESLGELTGKTVREDLTQRIFEKFCIGK